MFASNSGKQSDHDSPEVGFARKKKDTPSRVLPAAAFDFTNAVAFF
jgi:hypothetical protein